MKTKVFTVFDVKASHYLKTFNFTHSAEAIRAFTDIVNTEKTGFNLHPADYTLMEIGTHDNLTSRYEMLDNFIPLATGLEVKNTNIPKKEIDKEIKK